MAEKPRLKETDEILSSVGKRAAPEEAAVAQELTTGTEPEPALISSALDETPRRSRRPGSRRRGASASAEEPAEDRNPLDFGKYQLPGRDAKPRENAAPAEGAEGVSAAPRRSRARARAEELPDSPALRLEEAIQPTLSVPRLEEVRDTPPRRSRRGAASPRQDVAAHAEQDQPSTPEQRAGRGNIEPLLQAPAPLAQEEPVVLEYQFEDLDAPPEAPAQDPGSSPKLSRKREKNRAKAEAEAPPPEPEPQPVAVSAEEARSINRENFLRQLSNQFDQEFSQRFREERQHALPESEDDWLEEVKPRTPSVTRPQEPALPFRDEEAAERETEDFLEQFQQQVKQEEEVRAESFKDTLTEKFERERERYLRELGIDRDAPPPEPMGYEPPEADDFFAQPPEHQRRRLDVHIQPEMHMGEGATPVTYGRNAATRPLEEELADELPYTPRQDEQDGPFVPPAAAKQAKGGKGKKKSEDLLLELAAQNAMRQYRTPSGKKSGKKQAGLQFKFTDEEEGEKKSLLSTRNIVIGATAVALICLALVVGPAVAGLFRSSQNPALGEGGTGPYIQEGEDTLVVYENRSHEGERGSYGDVLVRRANVSLQNMSVANHLVIGDIDSEGHVLLRDVSVGGTIYVQNCGVNYLQLQDVQASQIIVSNDRQRVEVEVSGNSSIGTVELKTPGTVREMAMTQEALGVENVLVQGVDSLVAPDVTLSGLHLFSLVSMGDSIIALSDGTSISSMTSEGALSISGQGSVVSLAAGAKAGDSVAAISLRDVTVANVTLKSPASLDVGGHVDTMAVSAALSADGGGVIGTLTVTPSTENVRIPLDFGGVTVNTLISDAQTRINLAGNSRISTLICNESVYTLGNKVNNLVVNSSNVIYENEPDSMTVADGVRPPETVADNPNLDYNMTAAQNILPTDVSGDDVATTCNHTRESGGFVKGDGSATNPYEVSTPSQLAHISSHLDSHFIQTENIDVSSDSQYASSFAMIAAGGSPFTGVYDGMGYSITGLRIRSDGENVGLFAENTGTVRNVHIVSGEVSAGSSQRAFAGAVVGLNYSGGVVENCSNGATVTGVSNIYVGGIVGYNYGGKVRDCYNYAKITGVSNVGGIAGVSRENASVSNCYNVGSISGEMDTGAVVGANVTATVANCYYLSGSCATGIGSGTGNVIEASATELSDPQVVRDLSAGDDASLWASPPSTSSYTFPILGAPSSFRATSSTTPSAAPEPDDDTPADTTTAGYPEVDQPRVEDEPSTSDPPQSFEPPQGR